MGRRGSTLYGAEAGRVVVLASIGEAVEVDSGRDELQHVRLDSAQRLAHEQQQLEPRRTHLRPHARTHAHTPPPLFSS
jgi:hypothetical protein